MTPWRDQTSFVFVLSSLPEDARGEEQRLLGVIQTLHSEGATVQVVCQEGAPIVEEVRRMGIGPAEYRFDQFNVLRTRSRLRKFLKRAGPAIAHSSGTWGNITLSLAARTLPVIGVAMSVWPTPSGPAATRSIHRRIELARVAARADLVLASDPAVRDRLAAVGVPAWRLLDYPVRAGDQALLERYREFLRR